MPIWHVNSCRRRVQLPEEQPGAGAGGAGARIYRCRLCRTTRKTGRAWLGGRRPRTMIDWDTRCRTSPVWMRRTPRTSRASSRRALDHHHWFWTACTWTCRARLWQRSMQPVFRMGKDTLISCLISYLISSLISYMKICDMRSDIIDLWYHKFLISYKQDYDIMDYIIHDIIHNIHDIQYDIIDPWYHKFLIS